MGGGTQEWRADARRTTRTRRLTTGAGPAGPDWTRYHSEYVSPATATAATPLS